MLIVSADNGRDAIRTLQADSEIDIVLMDIMMPEMDGYETMRNIPSSRSSISIRSRSGLNVCRSVSTGEVSAGATGTATRVTVREVVRYQPAS